MKTMRELIEQHAVEMTILSPVHIGTGERLDSKSFWESGGKLWLVDEGALFRQVGQSRRALSDFERFCADRRGRLGNFLSKANIKPDTVASYGVECIGGAVSRDYYPHMKIPGKPPAPYVPGSSVKGAFRTCAVRGSIVRSKKLRSKATELIRRQMNRRRPSRKRADDRLEQDFFTARSAGRQWQNYDWMRLYQITDSEPLALSDLEVTEVQILSVRGQGAALHLEPKTWRPNRPITSHPEVLRPGTTVRTQLNILKHLMSGEARDTLRFSDKRHGLHRMLQLVNTVAKEQISQEWKFADQTRWTEGQMFYGTMVDRLVELEDNECLMRLGWGTGYDSQTVTDLLDDDTFRAVLDRYRLTVGRPGRDLNRDPLEKELAPKSRQVGLTASGQWAPLGWVKMKIE